MQTVLFCVIYFSLGLVIWNISLLWMLSARGIIGRWPLLSREILEVSLNCRNSIKLLNKYMLCLSLHLNFGTFLTLGLYACRAGFKHGQTGTCLGASSRWAPQNYPMYFIGRIFQKNGWKERPEDEKIKTKMIKDREIKIEKHTTAIQSELGGGTDCTPITHISIIVLSVVAPVKAFWPLSWIILENMTLQNNVPVLKSSLRSLTTKRSNILIGTFNLIYW